MKIIKDILTSKFGYVVMLCHWILCALAIYPTGTLYLRFHLIDITILLKVLLILDFFWIGLAESFISNLVDFQILFGFLFAGIQWHLIGYLIGKININKLK